MVASLYAAHPFWIWMAVAGLFLTAEVASGSGWLLWPAGAAALTGLLSFVLPDSLALELALFAGLTAATSLAGRRFMPKDLLGGGPDINDNVGRLVGKEGVAVGAFEHGRGRVFVDGKEWAAVAEEGEAPAADQAVRVLAAEGAVLRVKAL